MRVIIGFFYIIFSANNAWSLGANVQYKKAPGKNIVATIDGKKISYDELFLPIESQIFDAEYKLFELKLQALNNLALEHIMNKDPRKKGMSNDEFLEKVIFTGKAPASAEIEAFIESRQIPKAQVNDDLKNRVSQFLLEQKKRDAVQKYLAEKTAKNPIIHHFQEPTPKKKEINIAGAPSFGPDKAKVTLVEFSDFQCPACSQASKIVNNIKNKYKDKLKVVFKNFPLPFHKDAKVAAMAGLCAQELKKDSFWKMHDLFFSNQEKLSLNDIVVMGVGVGLDKDKFEKCITSNKFQAQIDKDVAEGNRIQIDATPTFFINGKVFSKAISLDRLEEYILREL